jgi:hypothetical protein
MISKYVGIMVCYSEPVGVNHAMVCRASGCESCEQVVVGHGALPRASDCES